MFSKLIYAWHWLFPRGSIPASSLNAWKQCFPAILKSKSNLSLWGKRNHYPCNFFVISCTLFLGHSQWEKLYSHCHDQRSGCFVAIMSPFIFLCVNQPWTANHRLHKTAIWQILPVIVYFFFCLGKADVLLRLQWDCTTHPDLHLKMQCTCVERWVCHVMHILSGRSPSAKSFSSQRELRDKKEARVTAPGAKNPDLRGTDHCQSSHKILGFHSIGWSWSPVFSYRDPLLPLAAGMRRKLDLLAHKENSFALGYYLLLCNSNLYLELKGEKYTGTAGIRVWGSKEKAWAIWPCKLFADQDEKH